MEKLRRGPLPDGFKNVGKHFLRFAPTSLAVALTVACSGEKDSSSMQLQVTPRVGESGTLPNPENPFAVLEMPFPKDPKMAIQQGWFYSDKTLENREHKGIDYIKGEPNNSRTWKSFPVKAAADGKACANPPSRQGNAVLITHSVGEKPIGSTYYGHLQKSEKDIPECSTNQTVFKGKGDKVGDAGSDGAQDQSWIHLHFQVNDANGNPIDPYGLEGERDIYPKPDFSDLNQKPCGPTALFTDCYPKGAVVAGPKDHISPISGSVKEKSDSITATPTATPKKETLTQIQKEQPKSIEQQAQEIVLRTWLNLWNSEQKGNNVMKNFVDIKITNANVEDVINKKGVLTNSLNVKWTGGGKALHPWEHKVGGSKYTGEAQIDKIKISTAGFPTSDADKANGLQWNGRVIISYIISYHGHEYTQKDWSLNYDAVEKWLHSEETNTFPNFSPWEEESVGVGLMLKNGKWQMTQLYLPASETGSPTLSGLKLPSKVLTYGGQTLGPCSYKEDSPCRTIAVDPPK